MFDKASLEPLDIIEANECGQTTLSAYRFRACFNEIERLRAALKPLAAVKLWSDSYPDIKADFIAAAHLEVYFTIDDVKAARAACADEQRAKEKAE